jgi:peroxiredoxin
MHQRVEPGSIVRPRALRTVTGGLAQIPDPSGLVHLQFRRFAGCPICSLHLRSFAQRRDEIEAAGVREVVLFHSTAEAMRKYVADVPFALVADPQQKLYKEFGVEASLRAFMRREAWPPIFRGIAHAARSVAHDGAPLPPIVARGGRHGLPCDVLVGPSGVVVASKYGTHADDQWSVDELLSLVEAETDPTSSSSEQVDG